MSKMITVVVNNQKGGVGKTTIASHIAWYYAERGARVLLVDLDTQRNFTMVFEEHASGVAAEALFADQFDLAALGSAPVVLIAGTRELVDVDELDRQQASGAFQRNFEALADRFDICVIDTPPAWGIRNASALLVADYVIGPMDLQEFAVHGISDLLDNIQGLAGVNPRLKFLGLLPNRFRWNSAVQKAHLADVVESVGDLVLPQVISLRTAYEAATQQRMPVWKLPKGSGAQAAEEMLKLLDHIQGVMGVEHAANV
jgi:chromosome partitioning protein